MQNVAVFFLSDVLYQNILNKNIFAPSISFLSYVFQWFDLESHLWLKYSLQEYLSSYKIPFF